MIICPPTVATGAYHAYLSVVVGDLNACQPNNTNVKTPDFLSMTFNNSSNTLVLSLFSYRKKSTPKHLMPNLLSIEDYAFRLNIVISSLYHVVPITTSTEMIRPENILLFYKLDPCILLGTHLEVQAFKVLGPTGHSCCYRNLPTLTNEQSYGYLVSSLQGSSPSVRAVLGSSFNIYKQWKTKQYSLIIGV